MQKSLGCALQAGKYGNLHQNGVYKKEHGLPEGDFVFGYAADWREKE
jgi:hypothetical protein